MRIKCILTKNGFSSPKKAHKSDAGYDLYSPKFCVIPAKGSVRINTGICVQLPINTVGMIKSRSSMNREGITCEGVIDAGYTGSIMVNLQNLSDKDYIVSQGDRIAQLVIMPIIDCELVNVDKFDESSDRGDNGFGSSGR